MELFKTPLLLKFEKTAVPYVKMTAAVDRWPEVLISSLQQQAPYLGDYQISAHIRQLDDAQGFGFGFLAVHPPTERSLAVQAGSKPVPYLRVPFVVKDWQLLPFDLFMQQDTAWPMTEKRVREALFSADTFDVPSKVPADSSIAKDLMPPASGGMSGSQMKMASRPLLCEALQDVFINQDDLEKAAAILDDPATAWAAERHASVLPLLGLIAEHAHEKRASANLLELHSPSVVQISRLSSGRYMLKAASADAYRVMEQEVDGAAARQAAGDADITQLGPGESYTVVMEPTVTDDHNDQDHYGEVKEAGFYDVSSGPRDMTNGAVLPMFSFSGEKLAGAWLVVGREGYAVKTGAVAACRRTGSIDTQFSDPVRGFGFVMDPKTASASMPFHVQGLVDGRRGKEILVKVGQRTAALEITQGIHGMVKLSEDRFAMPSHYVFRSMPEVSIRVEGDVMRANSWASKTASAVHDAVDIIGDRTGVYTLSSPLLRDVNGSEYKGVKEAQAIFVLGALGVAPNLATEKLAYCRVHGPVTLRGCRSLTVSTKLASATQDYLEKIAAAFPVLFNQPCLIKEAMEVDDIATVDKILGLNFLRPENVAMFVDYLPDLEKAVTQLADLLIAVRVGMRPLSEDAIRKAMFALEDTVQGLKTLAQTGPANVVKTAFGLSPEQRKAEQLKALRGGKSGLQGVLEKKKKRSQEGGVGGWLAGRSVKALTGEIAAMDRGIALASK